MRVVRRNCIFIKELFVIFFPALFRITQRFTLLPEDLPDEKRNVLKGLGAGLAVFLIICSLWITLISLKYGGLTISTSGSYNYALVGPESMGHPMLTSGLINPENGTISIWDDPSYLPVQKWSPIGSWANFIFQLNLLLNNTWQSINIIKGFSVLTLPIAILYTILCLYRYKGQVLRVTALYPILSALLFLSGFIIIFVEDRYIWIITILLILMGGELITYVMKSSRNLLKSKDNPNIRYLSILLALLMMISFALGPTMTIQYYMKQNPPLDKSLNDTGYELSHDYSIRGNLASDGKWGDTLGIAYYLNSPYYGVTKGDNDNETENELMNNSIDYYIVWGSHRYNFSYYDQAITSRNSPELTVYYRGS